MDPTWHLKCCFWSELLASLLLLLLQCLKILLKIQTEPCHSLTPDLFPATSLVLWAPATCPSWSFTSVYQRTLWYEIPSAQKTLSSTLTSALLKHDISGHSSLLREIFPPTSLPCSILLHSSVHFSQGLYHVALHGCVRVCYLINICLSLVDGKLHEVRDPLLLGLSFYLQCLAFCLLQRKHFMDLS